VTLRDLGLSADQERVYRILIESPDASVEDLRALGLSARDLRIALAGLVALGLTRENLDRPCGVRTSNVLVALGTLIEATEDGLTRQLRRVADTRELALTLTTRQTARTAPTTSGPSNGVERVEHLQEVRQRLEELSFFARDSVAAVQPGGPQSADALKAARPLDERSLRRGLQVRIVYDEAALCDDLNREYMRSLSARGADLRVSAPPFERLLILDSSVAVVPLEPGHSSRGALIVHEPGLVAGFVRLFEAQWSASDAMPWSEEPGEDQVSDEDRTTLNLLAQGVTDEAAARQAGISVRHLRRRIARVTDRLEASSRFEAGAEAARRGWI
jgi:hypothetical protein